jgi:hypothetical protein
MANVRNFLYSTIIVTGNYERQELNTFVAQLWAKHFGTHLVRWKRKIKYDLWRGQPRGEDAQQDAEQQSCCYEWFVPNEDIVCVVNSRIGARYHLGKRSPLAIGQIAADLGEFLDTEAAQKILDGTYVFSPDTDEALKALLEEAAYISGLNSTTVNLLWSLSQLKNFLLISGTTLVIALHPQTLGVILDITSLLAMIRSCGFIAR